MVRDYYNYEIGLAQGNADRVRQLEEQKTQHLQQLGQQQVQNTGKSAAMVGKLIGDAAEMGSRRLAHQIVYMDQTWGEFAKNFLKSIAEMILQALIMLAIQFVMDKMGIGWMTRAGNLFAADGGNFSEGKQLAAAGGTFRPIMAANGVEGVGEVSSATYFPRFNVIAGEAGKEMLTVLANPQAVDWNGIPAVVGKAGSRQLAIVDAAALRMPRMMAAGGFAGSTGAAGFVQMGLSGSESGTSGGLAVIELRPSPHFEAKIIRDSIEGAIVRVRDDLRRSSPISLAVKQLSS